MKYELSDDSLNKTSCTRCPYAICGYGPRDHALVGSVFCQTLCPHFISINVKNKSVKCKRERKNKIKEIIKDD